MKKTWGPTNYLRHHFRLAYILTYLDRPLSLFRSVYLPPNCIKLQQCEASNKTSVFLSRKPSSIFQLSALDQCAPLELLESLTLTLSTSEPTLQAIKHQAYVCGIMTLYTALGLALTQSAYSFACPLANRIRGSAQQIWKHRENASCAPT